jgi:hydrogenase-4 component F
VADAGLGADFASTILITLGLLSMVIAVLIILVQKNYKRLIAYSSVEHMGLIALGIGLGGAAAYAALFHLVYHSLTKALLFFATGNIFLKHSTTKIAGVRGVVATLPVTAVLFGIGVLAVTGMPPFGLFFTEVGILAGGVGGHPLIVAVVLIALIIGFIGFLRHMAAMLYGEPPSGISKGEADRWTVIVPLLLAMILILISLYVPQPLKTLLEAAAVHFS